MSCSIGYIGLLDEAARAALVLAAGVMSTVARSGFCDLTNRSDD